MFSVHLFLSVPDELLNYLDSCARIRKISRTRLMERVIRLVLEDQLVLSILDDDSKSVRMMPGEKGNSHFNRNLIKESA